MTQAFNLSQLANNTNTTGQINADTAIYNTVNVANGGTNLSATPTNGQLPIGNGSGYALATLTAGSGISVTNAAGAITIANTSAGTVTSITAGSGLAGGTITTSGTISVDVYNGTTQTNTSLAVGTYVVAQTSSLTIYNIYTSLSVWSAPSAGSSVFTTYNPTGGAGVMSGTWRSMGIISASDVATYLMRRTA
jgi:hypothetical protein